MSDRQRAIIGHSIRDVIRILENEPVSGDFIPEITVVQVMNRVSIAHLSIERAIKFLIDRSGGPLAKTHDLGSQFQELVLHDPVSAQFLRETFEAAVRHYRYNPNTAKMKHLKTLQGYLEAVGSDNAFQDIRYWELNQSMDDLLLRQMFLSIHMELLHGLGEILRAIDRRPMGTVANRVERAVQHAMWPTAVMAYGPGTAKEESIHSYIEWRRGFNTSCDALAEAVQKGFDIGDDFMADLTCNAYKALLETADQAVRYFASTLDVLSSQPRDVIPCVKWLGPEKEQRGIVETPGGTPLGFIDRGPDGLWYITPLQGGLVAVSAKARSQTDARCYLATLLTSPSMVTVDGEGRSLRIVREGRIFYKENYDETDRRFRGEDNGDVWTHKIAFWDRNHGIDVNANVRVEVRCEELTGMVDIVEGRVTEVAEHELYLSGSEWTDIEHGSQN